MCEKGYDNNSFKIKDFTKITKGICKKRSICLMKREIDLTINNLKKEIKEITTRTKEIKEDIDKLDQNFHIIDMLELNNTNKKE